MSEFRVEKDSMGEVKVPARAYYGAQTQRAVEHFGARQGTVPIDDNDAVGSLGGPHHRNMAHAAAA